jgi:hypothetical protein
MFPEKRIRHEKQHGVTTTAPKQLIEVHTFMNLCAKPTEGIHE